MLSFMKTIAIIGPTASGKSDLALQIALKHNAYILSLDSLSIYKEIDIASAKPSQKELERVRHFGINVLSPNEHFSVATFIDLYHDAATQARLNDKNLIIVGGTGFYLKTLLNGLSEVPPISNTTRITSATIMMRPEKAYDMLYKVDQTYMKEIKPNDTYRIEKMLQLYLETDQTPTEWFKQHPPKPFIDNIKLFEIEIDRQTLRDRIKIRTVKMAAMGLIDEIARLEHKYTRYPNSMKAIGIIEVLDYLDGIVSKEEMIELIATHTGQLAKRQQTFNRNQFSDKKVLSVAMIEKEANKIFN
ncbi:MAG: tRNA (adenosine(37)-N6)-dimethylallyltransferase MiaA [Epsilonproteobacteria bacterium]|nr:MAG: tRNA (adenosine(37)-N6)-dimethylallyltransferase MiaA [Campylobacterota bacterium]